MSEQLAESVLERQTDRFYGKYRGLVSKNDDPLGLGRIQASVPEVLADVDTGWALPCAPFAGKNAGLFAIPPVGAGVWIEFEAGDPSRPIWSGAWWGNGDVPKTEQGQAASQPKGKVLRTDGNLVVSLDDSGQTITVSDGNGKNLVRVKARDGIVEVRSTVKVVLEAPLIEHGENSTHPAVFGDELLTYLAQLVTTFNTHMHPGELALGVFPVTPMIAVPPMQPPTPQLVSTKNVVG